jgi:TRAP-type mannitol/chloroaromatic compound transport system permease small subunit
MIMRWLDEKLQRLAVGMILLGSVGMMLSMLICVADVTGTNFFGYPVNGTLEITESTMVLIVFGALAYTQEKRGHIRVELLHGFMSPRVQSFMDLVTHILAFIFFALLGWQSISELAYSWQMREATMGSIRFPLYPARFLLTAGTALVVAQLAFDVIADFGRMWRGEGPPSTPLPADTAKVS